MLTRLYFLSFFLISVPLYAQWVPTNGPYGGSPVTYFSIQNKNLFATIDDKGVFLSTDKGISWKNVYKGSVNDRVFSLASDDKNLFLGTFQGVFISTDNGNNWAPAREGLTLNTPIYSLAVFDSVLFAGTTGYGIFRSTNNGTSWLQVNSGFTNWFITGFAVKDNIFYAGSEGGGLLRSTDYGLTWVRTDSGISSNFIEHILPVNDKIYAGTLEGLFISSDSGTSWNWTDSVLNGQISSLAIIDSSLFAGTLYGGVYTSPDYGKSWKAINTGIPHGYRSMISRLAVIDSILFATTSEGVFKSLNKGASWEDVDLRLNNTTVSALIFKGSNLFAGTSAGVFISNNFGENWKAVNTGLPLLQVTALEVIDSNIFAGTDAGIFISSNDGASWEPEDSTAGPIHTFARNDTLDFAGGSYGVYLRTGNRNWVSLDSVATLPIQVNTIALIDSNLFAGTRGGLFRWSFTGKTWIQVNAGLTDQIINALGVNGKKLYAATPYGGVFLSTDLGENWKPLGLNNKGVASLSVINDTIIIGTDSGIYYTTNDGKNWVAANKGLQNSVKSICIRGNTIFAGTYEAGVWRAPLSAILTGIEDGQLPSEFILEQNYPNPFNPSTVIKYELPNVSEVTLTVYNLLGEKVTELLNTFQEAGKHEIEWNAAGLASGIYIYRIKADGRIAVRKALLLK